ncbi:T9SS type A sorting domain-containing protein [Sphingobacterium sp. MYb382]|uniref:T9SS type A sorting domain-containing protein n=1 Tax=Sphingobacterium sp. MYb382 TaxID=2745278 RepID=UPI0030AE3DF3
MKTLIRKIVLPMMLSVLALGAGRAMANVSSIASHPAVLVERADESNEKLINNVKVFFNPIAEQVSVNFKLGKQSTVAIKVMDALGNEVANLMNGRLDAGMQNLSFDGIAKLNPGVYFVRVSSGTETVIKRFSVR